MALVRIPRVIIVNNGLRKTARALSTLALPKISFDDQWNTAEAYESIPGMKKIHLVRAFLPGGRRTALK